MVGAARFELATSWSRTRRATELRYTPEKIFKKMEPMQGFEPWTCALRMRCSTS